MSRSDLHLHWELRGSDWITSVAASADGFICVGGRDGEVLLLDGLGNELDRLDVGSWAGAACFADLRSTSWGSAPALFALIGTKAGDVLVLFVDTTSARPRLVERYRAKARNTVRSIDVWVSEAERRAVAVFGSEDRHVYSLTYDGTDWLDGPTIELNGWVRAVAIATARLEGDQRSPVILSGCGDKNVYVHRLDGSVVKPVFVDAKVHALCTGVAQSDVVYGVSDAKKYFEIRLSDYPPRMTWERDLPHRATHLVPLHERGLLVASAEDLHLYVISTMKREISAYFDLDRRGFALSPCTLHNTDVLLLGQDGRMTANLYEIKDESPLSPMGGPATETPLPLDDAATYAEVSATGLKLSSAHVGIGRFLYVIPRGVGHDPTALVASDEGYISIVGGEPAGLKLLGRSDRLGTARAWAVDGSWAPDGSLTVRAATSDRCIEVLTFRADAQDGSYSVTATSRIDLRDWPREIRPVIREDGTSTGTTMAWCENGDVVDLASPDVPLLETGETLRSGFAQHLKEGFFILTGSDQNNIRCYVDGTERWTAPALDRVREVQIHDDRAVAVSEDRHLYVLNLAGELFWKYRFPHRALCVEPALDFHQRLVYLVGCGDGSVYGINENGFIVGEYKFPDRIRDVRLYDGRTILVACEDGYLYSAVETSMIGRRDEDGDVDALLDDLAASLRRAADEGGGLAAVQQLSIAQQLLLVSKVQSWMLNAVDTPLLIALIDRVMAQLRTGAGIKAHYDLARALMYLMSRISFSNGHARLVRVLENHDTSPYLSHALIAALVECEIVHVENAADGVTGIDVVDSVVAVVDLGQPWVRTEAIRHLGRVNFYDLRAGGFLSHLRSGGMPATRYTTFLTTNEASAENQRRATESTDVRSLLSLLPRLGTLTQAELSREVDLRAEQEVDEDVINLLVTINNFLFSRDTAATRLQQFFDRLRSHMRGKPGEHLIENARSGAFVCRGAAALALVAENMRLVRDGDPNLRLTPVGYLTTAFTIASLHAFAERYPDQLFS